MKEHPEQSLFDPRVAISKLPSIAYDAEALAAALLRLGAALGWDSGERGALGKIIARGARVLIKPNFVLHENEAPYGMEPMVTHGALVRAVTEAALAADAAEVLVGDAPVQKCDFAKLLSVTELGDWAANLSASNPRFQGIRDFRRTTCIVKDGVRVADENKLALDRFVLFDLAHQSLLEPVSSDRNPFRVTCYDPRLMAKTHAPGRHQYLVAKEVLEADILINLPKLKTHKKAGITCALKNLIGINGNKEYLPHHRVGGARRTQSVGGDCYPGGGVTKRALEYTLDRQNMASSAVVGKLWSEVSHNLQRVLKLTGDELGVEGSWSGNDTIWRTCLDLNRILLYGRADGSMAKRVQRRVLHIADAVIAGQGDGPLAPAPLPLGVLLGARNAAAMDYAGALLLGYDPLRLPVVREAFGDFALPLTAFAAADVTLSGDLGTGAAYDVLTQIQLHPAPVIHPLGWRDAAR